MDKQTIAATVNAYFACIQTLDQAGWQNLFTADGLTYDPVGNPPSPAHERAADFFALLTRAFSSIQLAPDQIFICGNNAAVKWTMHVVGQNQRTGEAEGISTFELDESGKIRVVSSYWDDAALMQQLRG
jgi:ketosteroid isomerase-like protein